MLAPPLLHRLVASKLVPNEAKLAAIESWQIELTGSRLRDVGHRELETRLAEARQQVRTLIAGGSAATTGRPRDFRRGDDGDQQSYDQVDMPLGLEAQKPRRNRNP
jgi:hypothetical protein